MKRYFAAALILLGLLAPAHAQIFPDIPGNTVVGRAGSTVGQPQAIPFSQLSSLLASVGNPVNPETGNYTIQTTDCGKIIQAGTGSTGFFTVTLPAATGFPSPCGIIVYNGDSARGKELSGFPSITTILYPGQQITAFISNGAWKALPVGRWRVPTTTSVYVDNVNGSDSNDGLAAGAGGALRTINVALNAITQNFDFNEQQVTLQFAASQTWTTSIQIANNYYGGGSFIIDGGGSSFSSSNGPAFQVSVPISPITVQNIALSGGNGDDIGLFAAGVLTVGSGVVYNTATLGAHVEAQGPGAYVKINGNSTVSGDAGFGHYFANLGGVILYVSGATSFSTSVTLNHAGSGVIGYATSSTNGVVNSNSETFTLNGNTVTTMRYYANINSSINTGGSGATYFPGSSSGSTALNGVYD